MNKLNAHLYLPFVQALAEGKTIQRKGLEWYDCKDVDFKWSPSLYRIKPLEWPPIPEGCSLHNPDGLTPEQVGDGYRLTVVGELPQDPDKAELWGGASFEPRSVFRGAEYAHNTTYRVPISTPFPDGSKIVDGKLVKLELAPCPKPKKQVPLGWNDWLKDGPWWVRAGEIDPYPCLVVEAGHVAIFFGQGKRASHKNAMSYERSNDGINWQPCSKEAP